jgi:signal peptidase II
MPQTHTFKSFFPLVGVAFPMFIIDQLTKWLIQANIRPGHHEDIIPIIKGIFNIRHDTNNGAAFGLMPGQNVMLIIVTILAIALIFVYYRHFRDSLWMKIALGFLLGGALGNFADRVRFGAVIDFLQFGVENAGWWWPTFNVADVSVCIGAGMLIVHLIRNRGDYDAAKQVEN